MSDPDTALQTALAQLGDRWTLQIVAALLDGPRRFGDLQADVAGIAPNVLSQRLKAMERDGLVVATPYQRRPPRFAYEVTARGRELDGVLHLLTAWVDVDAVPGHAACGTPLTVRWWCPTCGVTVEAPDDEVLRHL